MILTTKYHSLKTKAKHQQEHQKAIVITKSLTLF